MDPFDQFGSVFPSQDLAQPQTAAKGGMLETKRQCCASPAQQGPKYWCAINTSPNTKAKNSTVRAAVGK